jgi:hypothetical protein
MTFGLLQMNRISLAAKHHKGLSGVTCQSPAPAISHLSDSRRFRNFSFAEYGNHDGVFLVA